MTAYIYSVALAVPAAHRDAANAAAVAFGWQDAGRGPGTFSVPLSPDGATVTHYGTLTRATASFVGTLASPPPGYGGLLSVLLADVRECPADASPAHWADFLAANGLHVIEQDLQ